MRGQHIRLRFLRTRLINGLNAYLLYLPCTALWIRLWADDLLAPPLPLLWQHLEICKLYVRNLVTTQLFSSGHLLLELLQPLLQFIVV